MGEYRVYITINGEQTDISEQTPLTIVDMTNLGATKATRITERAPAQDGDTDVDMVLEPRIIPLIVQGIPNATYSYKQIRDAINRLFKATNASTKLGVVFEDGSTYEIDVKSIGDVELPLNLENQVALKVPVTLRAANPTWYDPSIRQYGFGLAGTGATLVPTAIPMAVGGSGLDMTIALNYAGTYKALPVFLVSGPITNLVIRNLSTGHKIDFTGITIASGDVYTIDLRFGRKLVYRNGNLADNRLHEVTADSNLAQWAIIPDPDVPDGVNSIKATGSALTSLSGISMAYYDRFDGI